MSYPPLPPAAKAFFNALRSPDTALISGLLHDHAVLIDGQHHFTDRASVEGRLGRYRAGGVHSDRIINRRMGAGGLVFTAIPQDDRGVAVDDPIDWTMRIEAGVITHLQVEHHPALPLPEVAGSFVRAVNRSDIAALLGVFSDDALVNDELVDYWNRDEIRRWAEQDVIGKRLALFVERSVQRGDLVVLTCHATGDFDGHGLPEPLVLSLYIATSRGKIEQMIILQKPDLD